MADNAIDCIDILPMTRLKVGFFKLLNQTKINFKQNRL